MGSQILFEMYELNFGCVFWVSCVGCMVDVGVISCTIGVICS